MPHRRNIQDSQTLISAQHCLQQNILFTSNKNLLLSWFQAATATLRRLWHKPWFLQGMENTDFGAGAKWCGTEGYLPSVSAQQRRNKGMFPFLSSQTKNVEIFLPPYFSNGANICGVTKRPLLYFMAEAAYGRGIPWDWGHTHFSTNWNWEWWVLGEHSEYKQHRVIKKPSGSQGLLKSIES